MARATRIIVTSISLLATVSCTSPTETFETLEIVTEVLPALEPGEEYSEVLEAVGGDGAYTWTLDSGEMPDGVGIELSGQVAGMSMQSGTWYFTVSVSSGDGQTARRALALEAHGGPELVSPAVGAVLDNGCSFDRSNEIQWDFDWDDVPGATAYHLIVQGAGAIYAAIDEPNIPESKYRWHRPGYIIDANSRGWRWKVRAVDGSDTAWSTERIFHVEPNNTDCP